METAFLNFNSHHELLFKHDSFYKPSNPRNKHVLFLFSKNGFVINCGYFRDMIQNSVIDLYCAEKIDIADAASVSEHYLINLRYRRLKSMPIEGFVDIAESLPADFILINNRYTKRFRELRKENPTLFINYKTKVLSDCWILFHINNADNLLLDIEYLDKHEKSFFALIKPSASSETTRTRNELQSVTLDGILKRYIGSSVPIPYSLQNRKELYPIAFAELEAYTAQYE